MKLREKGTAILAYVTYILLIHLLVSFILIKKSGFILKKRLIPILEGRP